MSGGTRATWACVPHPEERGLRFGFAVRVGAADEAVELDKAPGLWREQAWM